MIGRIFKWLVLAVLVVPLFTAAGSTPAAYAAGTTYYVDSATGNDSNSGTSTSAPWKSLSKVNNTVFQPGDKILFNSGRVWTGTLGPKGSGTSSARITFDKYGSGATPIINGNGAAQAVMLKNVQYVTVQNLEITNTASTIAQRSGVFVVGQNAGTLNGIYLRNLDIHDVKGISDRTSGAMYGNAAIYVTVWTASGGTNLSRFNDLRIENNHIHDISTIGIYFNGTTEHLADTATFNSWYTGVGIRDNVIRRTGADGIVAGVCRWPYIERNAVYDAGINGTNHQYIAGIWSWATNSPTFQYNEVARTDYDVQSTSDSMAFDTDIRNYGNHIYQYNYSHDNYGGFFMSTPDLGNHGGNNIVRYNISQNDNHYSYSDNTISSYTNSTYFYNNVFFNNTSRGFKIDGAHGTGHSFLNNIFYVTGGPAVLPGVHKYSNNLYYGFAAPSGDANAVTGNPLFVNPGSGTDGYSTVSGYKLQAGSPAINKGTTISYNGGKDFWGNPLYNGIPDIGAYEMP